MATFKKAYIILAHKNTTQLIRLIESLNDGFSYFFIHIDSKSPIKKEEIITSAQHIYFIKSLNSNWGRFELVQATLNAMTEIKETMIDFDRIILLSGQDYPIKNNESIDHFFKTFPYSIFIDYSLLPNYTKWPSNGGMYRVNKYFFGFSLGYKLLARITNFLSLFFKRLNRDYKKIKHFHGSQWWTIDNYALHYILNFVNTYPEFTTFHKYTFAPDELFFQTILMNTDDPQITGKLFNGNNVYMQWQDELIAHPEILTTKDFDHIKESACLFARKFDIDKDPDILNMIDKNLLTFDS